MSQVPEEARRQLIPLEVDLYWLRASWWECWELNLGPLQEKYTLLAWAISTARRNYYLNFNSDLFYQEITTKQALYTELFLKLDMKT